MAKDKEADRENPATASDPAIERRRARGQTEAHKQMRKWDEGGYQTTDPTSGEKRGPLADHADPDNQLGPIGPEEGTNLDVDDDDVDMKAPRAARTARRGTAAETGEGEADAVATDAARTLAQEEGISLSSVEGTGVDGRITVDDVRAAANERDNR